MNSSVPIDYAKSNGIPYTDRWNARPQYWKTYNSLTNQGPPWRPGQPPYYSINPIDNYMSYLSVDPTKYKSFGISSYSYADPAPQKDYGTCACMNGKSDNRCAPGYKPVCSWQGDGMQCTCAKAGCCGQCDFGQGVYSGVWSGGRPGY